MVRPSGLSLPLLERSSERPAVASSSTWESSRSRNGWTTRANRPRSRGPKALLQGSPMLPRTFPTEVDRLDRGGSGKEEIRLEAQEGTGTIRAQERAFIPIWTIHRRSAHTGTTMVPWGSSAGSRTGRSNRNRIRRLMVQKDDWRLRGQAKYLSGATLFRRAYRRYRPGWDHDHCEFCWIEFNEEPLPETRQIGYCTRDEYYWICDECFSDFKEMFRWIGEAPQ